jgi:hypothetical protein
MALTKIKSGQIDTNVVLEHVSKTSTFTMTAADLDGTSHLIISNDTSGGAYNVTLPTPADWTGKFVTCLHQTGSNNLTFEQYGGSDIMVSGTPAATTYYTVASDGTLVIFLGNNYSAGGGPP